MSNDRDFTTKKKQSQGPFRTKLNPYLSNMYKEGELLTASNAYHRLDKNQHFFQNKAYAQTILNDLR